MSVLREKIFERKGEGTLKPQNTDLGHIEIPVTFTCAQYRDGVIDGTITLIEEDHAPYMDLFYIHEDTKYSLCAGERVEFRDIAFIADYLKLKHREITSATNKIFCRFDVSNLKSFMSTFEIEEGKVTFFQYEDDIWKDIGIYKKSGITGGVQIELNDDVRLQTIEAYKSLLFLTKSIKYCGSHRYLRALTLIGLPLCYVSKIVKVCMNGYIQKGKIFELSSLRDMN
jgi:hypothetical protein